VYDRHKLDVSFDPYRLFATSNGSRTGDGNNNKANGTGSTSIRMSNFTISMFFQH
jgi:hypothetical protein